MKIKRPSEKEKEEKSDQTEKQSSSITDDNSNFKEDQEEKMINVGWRHLSTQAAFKNRLLLYHKNTAVSQRLLQIK
jgi:hypothetical protein